MEKIPLSEQVAKIDERLNWPSFFKFTEDLKKNSRESLIAYTDKNRTIHLMIVEEGREISSIVDKMEKEIGESLVEKKMGLPFRKYKVLESFKQAKSYYADQCTKEELPKFKLHFTDINVKNIVVADNKKLESFFFGNDWRNLDKFFYVKDECYHSYEENEDKRKQLEKESVLNINARFDLMLAVEFAKKSSDATLKALAEDSRVWVVEDLLLVALDPRCNHLLDISKEDEIKVSKNLIKLMLLRHSHNTSADFVLNDYLKVMIEKEKGLFSLIDDEDFKKIIVDNIKNANNSNDLIEEINKKWNKYASFEKYFQEFKTERKSEEVLESIFPGELEFKNVATIDFNPEETWGYASNRLRGYYAQYRSTNEFAKLFSIVSKENNLGLDINVFAHDYEKVYTGVFKSNQDFDKEFVKSSFLKVLKIAGEVQADPSIPKAVVWNENTNGLSEQHYEEIAKRYEAHIMESKVTPIRIRMR